LDIEHDRLLKLNSVGTEMWQLLSAGETESQIVHNIAQKYNVNAKRVAGDLWALREKLTAFGLSPHNSITNSGFERDLSDGTQPSYPWYGQSTSDDQIPEPKYTIVLTAFCALAAFDLILFITSLKTLCACVKAWPLRGGSALDSDTTRQICSAVQTACVWYPKQALCLQRSAVTTCLLRVFGVAARMVVGVRPMPFMAHAWVEIDGAVVNDWRGVKDFYRSLISY
jgi:hypothetical protein